MEEQIKLFRKDMRIQLTCYVGKVDLASDGILHATILIMLSIQDRGATAESKDDMPR